MREMKILKVFTFLTSFLIGFIAVKTGTNLFWAFVIVVMFNTLLSVMVNQAVRRYRLNKSVEAMIKVLRKDGA